MKKEKKPLFFSSKGFADELLKEDADKQSTAKDKPMTKTEENTAKANVNWKKPRKRLSNEQGIRMIKEWDAKSVQEWADEFSVSYQTISNMAKVLNKKNASLCPPKTAKPKKREDIADEWIALLEKEQEK